MARPKRLQPLNDAITVLQETIEILPPLNADQQVVLNNCVTAREKLSHAFLYAFDQPSQKNTPISAEIEQALYHIQNAIKLLGRK